MMLLLLGLAHRGSTGVLLLPQILNDVVWRLGIFIAVQLIVSVGPGF